MVVEPEFWKGEERLTKGKRKNVGWRDGFVREGSRLMDECGEADKGLEICSGPSELDRDYG